jgi:hypothetical protein
MKEIPEAVVVVACAGCLLPRRCRRLAVGLVFISTLFSRVPGFQGSRVPGFQGSRLLEKGYTVCISALNGLNVCSNCNEEVDRVLLNYRMHRRQSSLLLIDCADELFQVTCAL